MNYCQELFSKEYNINPSSVFWELHLKSNAPFSIFSKMKDKYLLCSSPERFLQKSEDKIISQPIKGTRKRGKTQPEDQELISDLKQSEKDLSENIMIADLVRNDLSKTAENSSVKAEELCEIYTFDRVHQMISTISSNLDKKYNFVDVLESTFPMGSMTGAPKIKSMELIEKYETTKRSLFSAAYGYITPNTDFDFNVVIRSIFYDEIKDYISVMVGGAITINSDPKSEYEECLVKAKAMIDVLKNEK
jgi:para-aminobenzoate synthetase component 1